MSIPDTHQRFLDRAQLTLQRKSWLVGLAVGGSYLNRQMDDDSDLDLVLVVEDSDYAAIMAQRRQVAEELGTLLAAFTGEHVGEPRLLICLYDAPLLHVDLKFVTLASLQSERVEDPCVLWERAGRLTSAIAAQPARWPAPTPQWIEDRFWVWVHYLAGKLRRNELYEVLDGLSFLRSAALAPLASLNVGLRPRGVRFLERNLPRSVDTFAETIASSREVSEIGRALWASVRLYRELRAASTAPVELCASAERAATNFLQSIAAEPPLASRPATTSTLYSPK